MYIKQVIALMDRNDSSPPSTIDCCVQQCDAAPFSHSWNKRLLISLCVARSVPATDRPTDKRAVHRLKLPSTRRPPGSIHLGHDLLPSWFLASLETKVDFNSWMYEGDGSRDQDACALSLSASISRRPWRFAPLAITWPSRHADRKSSSLAPRMRVCDLSSHDRGVPRPLGRR